MKPHFLALIAVSIYALSCEPANPPISNNDRIDTSAILASIDSLGRVVQKAHDTRDEELLAKIWAKNGILVIAGNPPAKGRDSIVAALLKMPSMPEHASVKINIIEIQVLNAEWAYVFGVDSFKYFSPSKKDTIKETLTFFNLIRKTPEGWQTYRETLTPNQ
jgi:uncharacterized protein (TIGR02246 family)